jgi:hypothetical protein
VAKVSRSSKKQPAFDPSELEDLIFSPAVGKGVGSHLVTRTKMTTVGSSILPPVVSSHVATVVRSAEIGSQAEEAASAPQPQPVETPSVAADMSTVVAPHMATVATSGPATVPKSLPPGPHRKLWITENGDLVPEARVKRIRLAQDVVNSAEECVYDTLWNAQLVQTDDSCRVVQAGYDYLVKRSRLSRKTIQRIIAKLLEKDFITVETRADIYQRTATIYRVFSYRAVLERHLRKGRLYVAKMGPGFSYVQPLEKEAQSTEVENADLTTVARSPATTVVNDNVATMAKETTVTVVKMDRTTVVKMSPYLLDSFVLDNTSSSAHSAIHEALAAYGQVDDDVVEQLFLACRAGAADCTEDEIVHFIHEKGKYVQKRESRVHSPIGFLITAVPKCFSGEAFQSYRNRRQKSQELDVGRESEEQAAMDLWRREQEASLSDPSVSEQEKHLIRLCLGLNTS